MITFVFVSDHQYVVQGMAFSWIIIQILSLCFGDYCKQRMKAIKTYDNHLLDHCPHFVLTRLLILAILVLFCRSTSIVDGICAVTGDGECVIVCQQYDLQVAYLPNPHGYACDLFSDLCTR